MTAAHVDHQLVRNAARVRTVGPQRHVDAPIWPMPVASSLPFSTAAVLVAARVLGVLFQLAAMATLLVDPALAGRLAVGSAGCLFVLAAIRYAESGSAAR